MSSAESAWFTGRRSPTARLRLFCIPYAGGGASLYRDWAPALAPWIEVQPIQLPGRESRFAEPPLTSMDDIVEAILDSIDSYLDLPVAVFGHSMGALISYELVRRMQRHPFAKISALLVSSHPAPHLPKRLPMHHQMNDRDLRATLKEMGGTPESILRDDALMDLFSPLLRSDFRVVETYDYAVPKPLGCPIHAFGGTSDRAVSMDELQAWAVQTTAVFQLVMFAGDHFYLRNRSGQLLTRVLESLTPVECPR